MRKGYQRILIAALITLGILCIIGQAKSLVSSNSTADLVLINGKIITVDSKHNSHKLKSAPPEEDRLGFYDDSGVP